MYIAAYKPAGSLVTATDPHGRRTLFQAVSSLPGGLFAVGRLDNESEGLVLLTNDGILGHRLAHPRYQVERVYEVAVIGDVDDALAVRLRHGIELEDGVARAREARIIGRHEGTTVLRMTLTEGKKREIRRMLAACGCEVRALKRTCFGGVGLGDLNEGEWRHLSRDELRTLRSNATSIPRAAGEGPAGTEDRNGGTEGRRAGTEGKDGSASVSRGRGRPERADG